MFSCSWVTITQLLKLTKSVYSPFSVNLLFYLRVADNPTCVGTGRVWRKYSDSWEQSSLHFVIISSLCLGYNLNTQWCEGNECNAICGLLLNSLRTDFWFKSLDIVNRCKVRWVHCHRTFLYLVKLPYNKWWILACNY